MCFAAILLALSIHTVTDFDTGFHIRAGEQIWRTGEIPTRDFFSYTAEGRAWVDSQWLFQLVLHAAYAAGGSAGVIWLGASLVCAVFAALLAACHRRGHPLALTLGMALFAVFMSYQRFSVRPELVSLAFLATFVLGSERFAARPRAWLVALPLVQVVWANCHGLSILGPVYLGLGFAGDTLQALGHRFTARIPASDAAIRELPQRGALVLLCCVALLVNANGWAGIVYPFELFRELRGEVEWFPHDIAELSSPFRHDARSVLDPVHLYRIFVALTLAGLAMRFRRMRFADLLCYAAFLYLSASAMRNIPLFAVIAMPIAVRILQPDDDGEIGKSASRDPRIAAVTCVATAIVAIAAWEGVRSNALYRELRWFRQFGFGEYEHVPASIVERLRMLDGRFLNDSLIGGYLIWKLYPDKQVAIDGRWEVYGELLPRLLAAFRDPAAFGSLVRKFDIRAVVMSRASYSQPATLEVLARHPDFQEVLVTPSAVLYERVGNARAREAEDSRRAGM